MNNKAVAFIIGSFLFFVSGCATYQSKKYTEDIFKNISIETNNLVVDIDPLDETEKSVWYLNFAPAKHDLLPIFVSMLNNGKEIRRLEVDAAFLEDQNGRLYWALAVEKAIRLAQTTNYVAGALSFAYAAGEGALHDQMETDYYNKTFKPRIINPANRGKGIIFFHVPRDNILGNAFTLNLKIDDMTNGISETIKIPFKTKEQK